MLTRSKQPTKPSKKSKKSSADSDGEADGGVSIEMNQHVTLTFSLKYLVNFAKSSTLSNDVQLMMSNDVPLLVGLFLFFFSFCHVVCSYLFDDVGIVQVRPGVHQVLPRAQNRRRVKTRDESVSHTHSLNGLPPCPTRNHPSHTPFVLLSCQNICQISRMHRQLSVYICVQNSRRFRSSCSVRVLLFRFRFRLLSNHLRRPSHHVIRSSANHESLVSPCFTRSLATRYYHVRDKIHITKQQCGAVSNPHKQLGLSKYDYNTILVVMYCNHIVSSDMAVVCISSIFIVYHMQFILIINHIN